MVSFNQTVRNQRPAGVSPMRSSADCKVAAGALSICFASTVACSQGYRGSLEKRVACDRSRRPASASVKAVRNSARRPVSCAEAQAVHSRARSNNSRRDIMVEF